MKKPKKTPRDVNQLAKLIVDISTGNAPAEPTGKPVKAKRAATAKKTPTTRRKPKPD